MEQVEKTPKEVENKIQETESSDVINDAQAKVIELTEPESEHKQEEVQQVILQTSNYKEVEMICVEKKISNEPLEESKIGQASETSMPVEMILNENQSDQMNTETLPNLFSGLKTEKEAVSPSEETIIVNKELTDKAINNSTTIPTDQVPAMIESESMIEEKKTNSNEEQEEQTSNVVVEPMMPIEIDSGVVEAKPDSNAEDEIKEKTTDQPSQVEVESNEPKLVAETKVLALPAIATSESNAEMGPIDEKSEGIFLETTNETINLESTQDDDEKDISTVEKENAEEDADTVSNENTENLVTDENVAIANAETSVKVEPTQTTPKVQKKKAKTSTPNSE